MDLLLWLGILAVLLIIEAATVGLVTVWFAGGALAAAIASGAGAGAVTQWLLFLAVSWYYCFYQTACCQIYETGNSQNKCE